PRVRADLHRTLGARAVDVAMRAHFGAGCQACVANAAERADAHAFAQRDPAFEHDVDVDLDIGLRGDFAADVHARRIGEAHARRAQCAHLAALERAFELRELPRVVGAL